MLKGVVRGHRPSQAMSKISEEMGSEAAGKPGRDSSFNFLSYKI